MRVWFGCTTAQWEKYKKYYFMIRNYLKEKNCTILYDWLDDADARFMIGDNRRDLAAIYRYVTTAVHNSDAVVIEHTIPNFSSSHQINLALSKKKPTLVLRLHKDNPRFSDSYIEALKSPHLTVQQYSEKNYKDIIDSFLEYSLVEQGHKRYNIVLGKRQKYYLDWAAQKYGKSRSEIIREILDELMERDEEYSKILKEWGA